VVTAAYQVNEQTVSPKGRRRSAKNCKALNRSNQVDTIKPNRCSVEHSAVGAMERQALKSEQLVDIS
jgi:hypothetical protein